MENSNLPNLQKDFEIKLQLLENVENSNLPNLQKDIEIKLCVKFQLLRLSLILNSCQATIKKSNNSCKNIKDKNLNLINIIEWGAEFQLDR